MSTIDELSNRRQYFRIEDNAHIELAVLEANETAAEHFDLGPEFGLISEFQQLDVESKHLLRSISEKNRSLGQYLKTLNKKLDAMSRVLALSKADLSKQHIQSINLSEGGVAAFHSEAIAPATEMAVKLVLLPSYSGLVVSGKVMSCLEKAEGYELHIEFTDITEAYQQLIARHIMRKQSLAKSNE